LKEQLENKDKELKEQLKNKYKELIIIKRGMLMNIQEKVIV